MKMKILDSKIRAFSFAAIIFIAGIFVLSKTVFAVTYPDVILAEDNTLSLVYSMTLDETSVPDPADFSVSANGYDLTVASVDVTGTRVILTVSSSFSSEDYIEVGYNAGTNPIEDSLDQPTDNFGGMKAIFVINVGGHPTYSVSSENNVYVMGDDAIFTLDAVNDEVAASASAPGSAFLAMVNDKAYITSGTSVTILDTTSNTIVDTLSVPASAFITVAGTKLYAPGFDDNVYVIDSISDSIVATIPVGAAPTHPVVVGDRVYVANQTDGTVSAIDTSTDTVIDTITVIPSPTYMSVSGQYIYVGGGGPNISIINTSNDSVVNDSVAPNNAFFPFAFGDMVYFVDSADSVVIRYNIDSQSVVGTFSVGSSPLYLGAIGKRLYVSTSSGPELTIFDTVNQTVDELITVPGHPHYFSAVGAKIYIMGDQDVVPVVNDPTVSSKQPALLSFSTNSPDGEYENGDDIVIRANFATRLSPSSMTIELNNGASVELEDVNGKTLSGTYTIGAGEETPDLAVRSVTSASIEDVYGNTRTSYDIPASVGSFQAENSFITRDLGDSKNIEIGDHLEIGVDDNPYQISGDINGYSYVANQGSDNVSVIRISDNSVVDVIPVGEEPYGLAVADVGGTKFLYVANINSDDVSVINTSTNTVTDTISVGVKPYYVATVGTKVYVTNGGSNSVSVVDANTNTVTDTISVGSYPRGIKAHGTDLYVANYGDPNYSGGDYISVIDSNTDTVTDTIILTRQATGPRGVNVLGDKVYVANFRSNNVAVIDTNTNTIEDIIDVGMGPRGIVGLGTNIYVENFDDGTISVIDTNSNSVTDTIVAGSSPSGIAAINGKIYFSRFQDNLVSILDPETMSLVSEEEVSSGGGGGSSGSSGGVTHTRFPSVRTRPLCEPSNDANTSLFCGVFPAW